MLSFVLCIIALIMGYVFYGRFVEKVFGADSKYHMPCERNFDGIDYQPMATWRVYLIQFLNIAGTGPIFGAIMGILFGPAAYIWIVLGCIFAGATHDYLSGMISVRTGGASLPEQVRQMLGRNIGLVMRIFTMLLLIMVVAVFVKTPAELLANLTPSWGMFGTITFWTIVIFAYYLLATLLPISTLIGRIYPLFGAALMIMAVGVGFGIFTREGMLPELTDSLASQHPKGLHLFPMLFITIACGAISGFHATQSPMMARCLKSEKHARPVFYGAMITEGIIAMIWAAAAIKYTGSYEGLFDQMQNNPAIIVNAICHDWMGQVGAVLAILGVVAAPVTTGDTALRSARLIVADFLKIRQNKIWRRLMVAAPLAGIVVLLMCIDFNILWRYFGWFNQTLSVFTLWAITVRLTRHGRMFWITMIPALFMTMTCASFIFVCPTASGGFGMPEWVGLTVGAVLCVVELLVFAKNYKHLRNRRVEINEFMRKKHKQESLVQPMLHKEDLI